MLVFEEREKPEYPDKNLLEQMREPTTNATCIWRGSRDLNPGHISRWRALSLLSHPLLSSMEKNVRPNYLELTDEIDLSRMLEENEKGL